MSKLRIKPSIALLWLSGAFVVLSLIWCQVGAQRATETREKASATPTPVARQVTRVRHSKTMLNPYHLGWLLTPAGEPIVVQIFSVKDASPATRTGNGYWEWFQDGVLVDTDTFTCPTGGGPVFYTVAIPHTWSLADPPTTDTLVCHTEISPNPGENFFDQDSPSWPAPEYPATNYYCCTKDDINTCLTVQDIDTSYLTDSGYTINSGPHTTYADCLDVCANVVGPTACFAAKTHCTSYVLDGSCSEDGDFPIVSWTWSGDVTDTGITLSGTGTAGTKTVTLTVEDSEGNTDSCTATILLKALNEDGTCDWVGGGGGGGGGGFPPGGGTGYCAPLDTPNPVAAFAGFHSYNSSLLRFPVQFCGGGQGFEQHSGAPEFRTRVDELPGSESRLSYDVNGRRVVDISSMTFDEAAKDEWEAFLGLTDNGAKSFLYFDTARHILNAEVIGVSDGIETQFQLTYTRTFLEQSKTIDVHYPDMGYPPTYHPQGGMMAPTPSHMTQFLTLLLDGVESEVGWVVSRGTEAAPGGLLEIAGPVAPDTVLTVDGHFMIRMIIESPACPMLRAIGSGQYELSTPLRLIETEFEGGF